MVKSEPLSEYPNWIWIGLGVLIGAFIVRTLFPSSAQMGNTPVNRIYTTRPQTYTNLEEWEIKRDVSGRIMGVDIHRKAERGG